MISLIQRKSLKLFHPILKRLVKLYLSVPRKYQYRGIKLIVMPGVFHPGLFFSTKVMLEFLDKIDLEGKKTLELGAGSGLVAIYCAKRKGNVTASDINQTAIEALKKNALKNKTKIQVVYSDLLSGITTFNFDIILINPPYYPKDPVSIEEKAWFCGSSFEYFHRLFSQLHHINHSSFVAYMILSEDCEIDHILSIATENHLQHEHVYSKQVNGEVNFIYQLSKKN